MNFPPKIKDYCPKCKTHKVHSLREWKKGNRKFKRRKSRSYYFRRFKGYGANRPKATANKKQAKRFIALAKCAECGRRHYFKSATRMRKAVIKAKE